MPELVRDRLFSFRVDLSHADSLGAISSADLQDTRQAIPGSALPQCTKRRRGSVCLWGRGEGGGAGDHLRVQLGSSDGSAHMVQQVGIHHSVHHCGRVPEKKFDRRGCRIEILQVLCQAGVRRCCPLIHLGRSICSQVW